MELFDGLEVEDKRKMRERKREWQKMKRTRRRKMWGTISLMLERFSAITKWSSHLSDLANKQMEK